MAQAQAQVFICPYYLTVSTLLVHFQPVQNSTLPGGAQECLGRSMNHLLFLTDRLGQGHTVSEKREFNYFKY